MELARVVGHATSTLKHPTLEGRRLALVQPLDNQGRSEGDPQLALDETGSRRGDLVIVTTDGAGIRAMLGAERYAGTLGRDRHQGRLKVE